MRRAWARGGERAANKGEAPTETASCDCAPLASATVAPPFVGPRSMPDEAGTSPRCPLGSIETLALLRVQEGEGTT